jgi:hypothetical protein
VERNEVLVEGQSHPKWRGKISMFTLYHRQIANAFFQPEFSLRQDYGYPWGNAPALGENQPDNLYPQISRQFFDGLFEQVHDNYHGWVGYDMVCVLASKYLVQRGLKFRDRVIILILLSTQFF